MSSFRLGLVRWCSVTIIAKGIAITVKGNNFISSSNVVHNSLFNPIGDLKAVGKLSGFEVVSVLGKVSVIGIFMDSLDENRSVRFSKRLLSEGNGMIEELLRRHVVRPIDNSISSGNHFSTVFLVFKDYSKVLDKVVSMTLVSLVDGH